MTEQIVHFCKMHGLGNDFVVLDARRSAIALDLAERRALADRRTGIGCDQLIIIEPGAADPAIPFMRIYNPDGGEAEACGNATRCVGWLLMTEGGVETASLETKAGRLAVTAAPDGLVTVDMGPVGLHWRDLPLATETDTLRVRLIMPGLPEAACCSIGNPHATLFVEDADVIDLERLGPILEHDPIFPAGANIGFASMLGDGRLRLRVWERGAGATLACGSGACAALVAAARRGLCGREAEIVMARGSLHIVWRADGHVLMTGAVATSFSGMVDPARLVKERGR